MEIYVIAGTNQQAENFAKSWGLRKQDYVYINRPERLFGIEDKFKYVKIGTYYTNKNLQNINKEIRFRKGIEITAKEN